MIDFLDDEECFKFYKILPMIISIMEAIIVIVLAIVGLSSGNFGAFLLCLIIGAIVVILTYIFLKISLSPMILQVEYLKTIARNTTNTTLNSKSPSMLEQALVKHSNGVKTAKISEDEIIKKLTTLKDLYDQGILSEETYEKRKKEILDNNKKPEAKTIQER